MPPDPSSTPATLAYVKEWQARLASAQKEQQNARVLVALNKAKQTNDELQRKLDEMVVENMLKMVEPHD
jgi:hypothetical protein